MTEVLPQSARKDALGRTPAQEAHLRGWRWVATFAQKRVGRAVSASVVYSEDGSASLEMETDVDLTGANRAPVSVLCGYGSANRLYFEGTVDRAVKNPYTGLTHITAYGVMGAMGRQYFEVKYDFTNYSIPAFFGVIERLLYDYRAVIEVRPTSEIILEEALFEGETTLREAADRIIEPVDFTMRDRPDFDLKVGPKQPPVVGGAARYVYAPSNYRHGSLEINPSNDLFSKVIAFRREDLEFTTGSGDTAETETRTVETVRAEAEVINPGPNYPRKNEIYWIPDFPGSQGAADRIVRITADSVGAGTFGGTLTGIYANPGIIPDVGGQVQRVEDGALVTYSTRATSTKIELVGGLMDFTFDALKESVRELRVAGKDTRNRAKERGKLSPHVVPTRLPAVGRDAENRLLMDVREGENPWFGYDADGRFFIDPEREPLDVSGRNPDGSFFVDPEEYFD